MAVFPDSKFQDCKRLFVRGEIGGATECLARLKEGASPGELLAGGGLLMDYSLYAEALPWFELAAERGGSLEAIGGMAFANFRLRRYGEALRVIDKGLAREPRSEDLRLLRVMTLTRLDQYRAAWEELQKAKSSFPLTDRWLFAEGQLHLAERNLAKAGDLMRECIRLNPAVPDYRLELVHVLRMVGNAKAALSEAQAAVIQIPGHAHAHYVLGFLLKDEKRFDEAEQHFRKAVRLAPQHGDAGLELASILTDRMDFRSAADVLQKLVQLPGVALKTRIALGRCYRSLGEFAKAEEAFRSALRIAPDSSEAQRLLADVTPRELSAKPISASASPAGAPAITFKNITKSASVDFVLNNSVTSKKYSIETMIGGVALFDFDNDGFLDLFLPNGSRLPEMDKSDPAFFNRLYRNNGNGMFSDVTGRSGVRGFGYSMGVAAGDYDNDGYVDLYVAGVDRNQLLHNLGDGAFADVTVRAGVTGVHPKFGKLWSTTAGWFDYNRDGFLDLFVCNYLRWSIDRDPPCAVKGLPTYCHPDVFEGTPNILYRNNGDGSFTDVSRESGIGASIGKGMGVAFSDYNADGEPDIFVSNDSFPNFLFKNMGNGKFEEVALQSGVAYTEHGKTVAGMGVDFKDIDQDGRPDILQAAMFNDGFRFYKNAGRIFADCATTDGLASQTMGLTAYGLGAYDFDNDGRRELFTANGAILDNSAQVMNMPFEMPNSLFRYEEDGRFRDVSATSGDACLPAAAHRGAAFGDLNNDGRVDMVVVALNKKPEILLNQTRGKNHWLVIRLVGKKSNRDGIGAVVKITPSTGAPQHWEVNSCLGYNSSSDKRAYFGLGTAKSVKIDLIWPSGTRQTLPYVEADRILTVEESGSEAG